jgi:hypothetical protein
MSQARAEEGEAPHDLHEQARMWAEHWAQTWFLDDDGTDRLRFGPIDAGWATHAEAYYVLHSFALDQMGIARTTRSLTDRLKASGHDRMLRAAAAQVSGHRQADRHALVACVLEIPTPSMTDGVIAVARALGEAGATLSADTRATRRAREAGVEAWTIKLPLTQQLRLVRNAKRHLELALAGFWNRPPRMLLHREDVGRSAIMALQPLIRRSAPWLAAEYEGVAQALERLAPHTVVVASDQHRIGRLASAFARASAIRTIVVQHGLPQMRVGLVPVVADVVASWSDASREWFIGQGTDPNRLAVTGNPRWAHPPTATRQGTPTVLVALSPAPTDANRRVLSMAIQAAAAVRGGSQLVVKLHPGHRDWDWVDDIVHGSPTRVAYREPIEPLVARASVTLVLRSTVAMDALAAGCPVVLVRVPGARGAADLELRDAGLPVVDTPEALAAAIESVASERNRSAYFAERGESVRRLIGPPDALDRVVRLALSRSTNQADTSSRSAT